MTKVNLMTIKPWISERITALLSFEDDVLIAFIFSMLESEQHPCPRSMQVGGGAGPRGLYEYFYLLSLFIFF